MIYIAGKPIADYAVAQAGRVVSSGAPMAMDSNGELLAPVVYQGKTQDQSEILKPTINTQYGTISCEAINLTAPLYYGDNSYALQNGAGQYAKSSFPGEGRPILIGGHDGTFFAPLQKIKKGDVIRLETTLGDYEYEVTGMKVADKADTDAYDLTQDKEQLILYTCYPFGKLIGNRDKRYFVYCNLKSDAAKAAK